MPRRTEVPAIIKEIGFDFWWDNKKVWELDVPTEEMAIGELIWHFEIPFWSTSEGYYDLKPSEVINDPEKYKTEFDRIIKVDTTHPLDIMNWRGRWLLLDGLHRLAKEAVSQKDTVKVRKIPQEAIPQIKKIK